MQFYKKKRLTFRKDKNLAITRPRILESKSKRSGFESRYTHYAATVHSNAHGLTCFLVVVLGCNVPMYVSRSHSTSRGEVKI